MAVEVIGGYVTMKFDLGGGQTVVVNNQMKVDDGEWHEVIAERSVQILCYENGSFYLLQVSSCDLNTLRCQRTFY